jgi:hypothetical protein
MPTLKKALAELTSEDLTAVLLERWPEDEQLELKQAREGAEPGSDRRRVIQLDCDGTVTYFWSNLFPVAPASPRQGYLMYPGWLFGLVLNAFSAADRFRAYSSAHAVEYVFEIEVIPDIELPVMSISHWEPLETAGSLPPTCLLLPKYAVGGMSDRSAVLNLVWRDFWNAVGIETKPGEFQLV